MTETSRTPFLAIAAAGLLAACDAAAPAPVADDDAPRQRIGKSDWSPVGTCKDACDGKTASGNCWCDDLCATYGDCCSDKATVCDAGGCVSDDQCGDDQYCAEIMCITTPCPPSTCVAKASEGMFCSANVPCSEGLSCSNSTWRCSTTQAW